MCFHNSMSKKAQQLAARYGRKSDIIEIVQDIINEQYHVNAFNFPKYPVITNSDEIQVFNWGLVPFWVKTESDAEQIRKMTLNARSDTIFEKPSFREPIMKKRCIIPSTGYFEWRHEGTKKIPYYIYLKDEEIFSMAGIYDRWLDKETGEEHDTFSIITTDTNPLTDYIHNTKHRMPAILTKGDEEKWLDTPLTKVDIQLLLTPFDADKMDAYQIDNDFIKKAPNDPNILLRA
ncbi:SOS response-associated peptidase [Bacteroides sp.]|uniref:SOS response-associated peptidase n=1 Tax=Bacteroides sp. TaxID=29523 RepID=UPI0026198323|nr:SOS response-associated peptidase [Bacteroides sp.]MDD3038596.1 SOS response-associated peptidase [Bacteroides sp.]